MQVRLKRWVESKNILPRAIFDLLFNPTDSGEENRFRRCHWWLVYFWLRGHRGEVDLLLEPTVILSLLASLNLRHLISPLSFFFLGLSSGMQSILGYVRPRRIVAVYPPKRRGFAFVGGIWRSLQIGTAVLWCNWRPLKDAAPGHSYCIYHVASSDYIETAKEAGLGVELPEAVYREGKERIHLI